MKFRLTLLVWIFSLFSPINSEEVILKKYGISVNLPMGWTLKDRGGTSRLFSDSKKAAFFQVSVYPGEKFQTSAEMYSKIIENLQASGEQDRFSFSGLDSIYAYITFESETGRTQANMVLINGTEYDIVLIAFASGGNYDSYLDQLLSCIDSFLLDKDKNCPGPVSQYYYQSFKKKRGLESRIKVKGKAYEIPFDQNELETSQLMIEREFRILKSYQYPLDKVMGIGWSRYYRMIYKDNYTRLNFIAELLRTRVIKRDIDNKYKIAEILAGWIQNYKYRRAADILESDLISPLICSVKEIGDCDSKGLLYMILLKYMGIDSILLVSKEYGHSVVGVDIPGKGARFNFGKKDYLIVELNTNIDIGLIDRDMADPVKWRVVLSSRVF